jgi:hypothetical protein
MFSRFLYQGAQQRRRGPLSQSFRWRARKAVERHGVPVRQNYCDLPECDCIESDETVAHLNPA